MLMKNLTKWPRQLSSQQNTSVDQMTTQEENFANTFYEQYSPKSEEYVPIILWELLLICSNSNKAS